jgi:NAD(P)-dependent dehydrogenase (short-subunit alcohol dehydrogenase family)
VIVNTGSISGFTASPMEAAYCVSKGAVMQLTRAIAVEFRDRGIRCNALLPGFIRTPHGLREMDELVALGVDAAEPAIAAAQGRMCEPDEVARVALFLASDASSFINGEGIVVDNASTITS